MNLFQMTIQSGFTSIRLITIVTMHSLTGVFTLMLSVLLLLRESAPTKDTGNEPDEISFLIKGFFEKGLDRNEKRKV